MTTAQEKLDLLKKYFAEHEIRLHGIDVVAGVRGSGDAVGVIALEDLQEDTVVAEIHKDGVLSRKSTAIGDILEEHELGGGPAVALALMFERSQGDKSPFHLYLQSLPYEEPTLFAWTDEELEMLKGTEPYEVIKMDKPALKEDYENLIKPILAHHKDIFPADSPHFTFKAFAAASSIVASRAFQMDEYHGDCLVPLADAFNHLTDREHVHLENDQDVCPVCGSSWPCPQHAMSDDEDEEEENDGHGHHCEGGHSHDHNGHSHGNGHSHDHDHDHDHDHAAHGGHSHSHSHSHSYGSDDEAAKPAKKKRRTEPKPADSEEGGVLAPISDDENGFVEADGDSDGEESGSEQSEESEANNKDDDKMEMRLIRPVKKGEEVFNTYGKLGNSSLLHKHGFVDEKPGENPFDVVTVSVDMVEKAATAAFPGISSVNDRIKLFWKLREEITLMFADEEDEDGIEDMEGQDLDTFFFRIGQDGAPEHMLLALLAVCESDDKLIRGWKDGSKTPDKLKRAVAEAISAAVQDPSEAMGKALVAIAQARLDKYPTTLDQDQEQYAKAEAQSREFQALTIRISEKMILGRMVAIASVMGKEEQKPKTKKRSR